MTMLPKTVGMALFMIQIKNMAVSIDNSEAGIVAKIKIATLPLMPMSAKKNDGIMVMQKK